MNRLRQIARTFVPYQTADDALDTSQPLSSRLISLATSIVFVLGLLSFLTKKNAWLSDLFMHAALILFGVIFLCLMIWVMAVLFKSARTAQKNSQKIPRYILFITSTVLILGFVAMVAISLATGN